MSEAVTPGPDFDWKREAEHYRYQCDQLRELLREVEEIGDQLDSASSAERDALRAELDALRAERDEAKEAACLHRENYLSLAKVSDELVVVRDRYRDALERIAGVCQCTELCSCSAVMHDIARAALAGGKETG